MWRGGAFKACQNDVLSPLARLASCSKVHFDRKAYCAGNRTKPSLVVDTHYALWLGNETTEEMRLEACELCGFNVGSYEEKVVAGCLGMQELKVRGQRKN